MSRMAWLALVLVATACGAPESATDAAGTPTPTPTSSASSSPSPEEPSPSPSRSPRPEKQPEPGTVVTVGPSPFGQMLFDDRRQAVYLFEPEADGRPACYGACEEAWPPVLTDGPPVADGAVEDQLLGVVRRRDGSRQVTYNGWPLYFYANEGPGEVLCHDVVLNGGLWLALGADGRALPT
ncbi:COG4315 family predicted lipoprotein [Nocardioides euryhalodurans]|uniref:Lipoprotein n=1 Tax=Nocardioides euryhalodurans TaxID=2518370 RepID=A0A4P7GI73_9ACTN|nr:hypothetical protein [Nocardioides euryhalodurans]QBR91369.1 hypothetical protein EXE57_03105 [Nocardioides euryhalodurans]